MSVDSDEETRGSPDYQESDDSGSRTDTGNGDDDGQGSQGATDMPSRGHTTMLDDHSLIQFFTYNFNLHLVIHDRIIFFLLFDLQVRLTSLTILRTRIMVLQALNELPLHRESDNSNNSVTYNRIALAHSVSLALKVAIQRMCTTVPKLLIILLLHGCMNGKSLSGMLNCTLSGKQHHHGQVKVGRNTRRGCYIHMA